MRFFSTVFSVAAAVAGLAGLASAAEATTDTANPIRAPLGDTTLKAGEAFTITWSPNAGSEVSLILRKGESGSLDTLEVIADKLPNNGAFIWIPSTELEGASDYAIQVVSEDPLTSNYSPRFKIDSNGAGLPKSTTILPSTTRSASISIQPTATYTGTGSMPTATEDTAVIDNLDGNSGAAGRDATRFGLLVAIGAVVGGVLV